MLQIGLFFEKSSRILLKTQCFLGTHPVVPIYNQKAENQQRDILFFSSQIMYSVPRFLKNYVRPGKNKRLPAMIEKAEFCVCISKRNTLGYRNYHHIAHMNFLTTNTYQ